MAPYCLDYQHLCLPFRFTDVCDGCRGLNDYLDYLEESANLAIAEIDALEDFGEWTEGAFYGY